MCRTRKRTDGADERVRDTAYSDVMKLLLIAATVLSVVPLALAFFMPNWYLGDKQNAVDAADLKGERVVPAPGSEGGAPQETTEEKRNAV